MVSLTRSGSLKVRSEPSSSSPEKTCSAPCVADTHDLPPATTRTTVTPEGAGTTAIASVGVGEGVAAGVLGSGVGVDDSAGADGEGRASTGASERLERTWKPTTATTTARATPMAALQLGPRRSAREECSSSKTAAAVDAGSPWLAAKSASSGAGSTPIVRASVVMCPRA